MKKIFYNLKKHNLLFTLLMIIISTILCFWMFYQVPENQSNITLVYILALIIISRYTSGYSYGIITAFFFVVIVNYCFTFPYFSLNFTLSGYPVTFIEMLAITVLTSAATTHMANQSTILAEREKQLTDAKKEKLRANLLRAISHDLRTPLTGIIGAASSLIENTSSLSENEKKNLARQIYDDSSWLINMVENLLSITRINNDTAKVKKNTEVVEEVVSEAVSRLKKRIPEAKICVTVPMEPLMLSMDAILIEQVIINLLENAFTHSQSEKPIDFEIKGEGKNVIFKIKDYGVGIDETRIDDIFSGIPAKHTHVADSKKGMEIGLSICKAIILAHGGTISAQNHENGAEFIFTLPKETTADE